MPDQVRYRTQATQSGIFGAVPDWKYGYQPDAGSGLVSSIYRNVQYL